MNDEVIIAIRIQFEHDENYDVQEAREEAENRVMDWLAGAGIYNYENGLKIIDIEDCGETW